MPLMLGTAPAQVGYISRGQVRITHEPIGLNGILGSAPYATGDPFISTKGCKIEQNAFGILSIKYVIVMGLKLLRI